MQKRSSAGRICGAIEKMPCVCILPLISRVLCHTYSTARVGNRTHYPLDQFVFQIEKRNPLMNIKKKMMREFETSRDTSGSWDWTVFGFSPIDFLKKVTFLGASKTEFSPKGTDSPLHHSTILESSYLPKRSKKSCSYLET